MFVLDKIEYEESESEIIFEIFMGVVYEGLGGGKPPMEKKDLKLTCKMGQSKAKSYIKPPQEEFSPPKRTGKK